MTSGGYDGPIGCIVLLCVCMYNRSIVPLGVIVWRARSHAPWRAVSAQGVGYLDSHVRDETGADSDVELSLIQKDAG